MPPDALAAVRDKHGTGAQVYTELDQDPLPLPLLKKYIAYARAHVHPVLSDEAKQAWASTLTCSAVPPLKMRLSRPLPAPNTHTYACLNGALQHMGGSMLGAARHWRLRRDGGPFTTRPIRVVLATEIVLLKRVTQHHVMHAPVPRRSAQVLRAFYLELRANAPAADGAPITTRQLESLVRLTEARARADLRATATRRALLALRPAPTMRSGQGRAVHASCPPETA